MTEALVAGANTLDYDGVAAFAERAGATATGSPSAGRARAHDADTRPVHATLITRDGEADSNEALEAKAICLARALPLLTEAGWSVSELRPELDACLGAIANPPPTLVGWLEMVRATEALMGGDLVVAPTGDPVHLKGRGYYCEPDQSVFAGRLERSEGGCTAIRWTRNSGLRLPKPIV